MSLDVSAARYALNYGLTEQVDAAPLAQRLPDAGFMQPNELPFVGEVDRLLSANGSTAVLRQWAQPESSESSVRTPGGYQDALESALARLKASTAPDGLAESDAKLRQMRRVLDEMLPQMGLARDYRSAFMQV